MTHAFCTVTAQTKRPADLGAGSYGAPAAYLDNLAVTPLWPLSQDTQTVLGLNSPREFKECYHVPNTGSSLPDVREGDVLTVAGVDYPIAYAGEWTDGSVPCLHLVVQEVKGT